MIGRSAYDITPRENVSGHALAHKRLYGYRYMIIISDSSGIEGPTSTQKGIGSSMEAVAGGPRKDSQIGIIGVVKTDTTGRTHTDMPIGTALEAVFGRGGHVRGGK